LHSQQEQEAIRHLIAAIVLFCFERDATKSTGTYPDRWGGNNVRQRVPLQPDMERSGLNIVDRKFEKNPRNQASPPAAARFPTNEVDLAIGEFIGALKRHPATIAASALLAIAIALSYLSLRLSVYQSTATLIIDPARPNILASQQVTELPVVDSAIVDSAVEIIRSDFIAQDVAKRLNLANDREFTQPAGLRGLLQPVRNLLRPRDAVSSGEAERAAALSLQRELDVRRIGLTYVVQISARSLDPQKSARIANSFVDAYLDNQLSVKLDMTRRASTWLETRTEELRQKVMEADNAVQSYRVESGLIETGGKLPLDQQLSELTSKLSAARAEETQARVKVENISELIAQNDFNSAAVMAPPESTVRKVRDMVVERESREREIADRAGRQHRLTLEARKETDAARSQLRDEVMRFRDGLLGDASSAAAQVAQLDAELKAMTSGQLELGSRSIKLRELERNASSVRQLYETFLGRLKELNQLETLAVQDARVIASAGPASNPSNLSGTIILAAALGIGLLGGIVAALLRDRFDPQIRNEYDAQLATGRPVLAVLGELNRRTGHENQGWLARLLPFRRAQHEAAAAKRLLTYAVAQPFSLFAEGIRQLRMALNHESAGRGKVVGMVAALPGQGRSTVASNLAHQLAASGVRTILIDCDLRNPELSEQLLPGETEGLPDVLSGSVAWQNAAKVDGSTGLALLSGKTRKLKGNPSELLMLQTFEELLDQLSQVYDTIILDLAPFGVVSDARGAARLVDMFVLVASQGLIGKQQISDALAHAPEIHGKLIGVVLNQSNVSAEANAYRQPRAAILPVTGTSLGQNTAH
jgi:succinoglycan biosynthesis transport protein ExoP